MKHKRPPYYRNIQKYINSKRLYLVEFSNEKIHHKAYSEQGNMIDIQGMKISRIIGMDNTTISEASKAEHIPCDLSVLLQPETCIVTVASVDGKTIQWLAMNLLASNTEGTEFVIDHKWLCSDSEVKVLNSMFPEYFINCSLDSEEFDKKNTVQTNKGTGLLDIPGLPS